MRNTTDEIINRKNFQPEEFVRIDDYLGRTLADRLPGHGTLAMIIRRSRPEDMVGGDALGERSASCWFVAVAGQKEAVYHYHQEWLKKV